MQRATKIIVSSLAILLIAISYTFFPAKPHQAFDTIKKQSEQIQDVVIVVVDTLRADVLPWHGGDKATAPFLNSLTEKALVFDHAYSGCSSTAPAMASVFTGRYPSRHGVITGLLAHKRLVAKAHELKLNKIPSKIKTLPEYFKSAGFQTLGVADNLNISEQMGFAQGFDSLTTTRNIGAHQVTNTALAWQSSSHKKRLFYIHYMDPHSPYEENKQWLQVKPGNKPSSFDAYKSEVRKVDEHLKRLFAKNLWKKDALIIFLADHGEAFAEHETSGHGKNLHSEVIRVPFFISHPTISTGRVRQTVHTADILPTLADIFGWETDSSWQGQSLLDKGTYGRPLFSELLRPQEHPRTSEESVIADGYQLIVAGEHNTNLRLYDIYKDPQQVQNLINESPDQARKLLALLTAHRSSSPQDSEATTITMDEEGLEHLKTLGYLQ